MLNKVDGTFQPRVTKSGKCLLKYNELLFFIKYNKIYLWGEYLMHYQEGLSSMNLVS
jgi:hypothetical protein